jgi:hypothetical protein
MSPVADRTTDGNGAYHVWLYGLSINDMLSLRLIFDLEYYPTGAGVWLDYQSISVVGSNSNASDLQDGILNTHTTMGNDTREGSKNTFDSTVPKADKVVDNVVDKAKGWDFVDDVIGTATSVFSTIMPLFGGLTIVPMSKALTMCRNVPQDHVALTAQGRSRSVIAKKQHDEEKDDFQPIDPRVAPDSLDSKVCRPSATPLVARR